MLKKSQNRNIFFSKNYEASVLLVPFLVLTCNGGHAVQILNAYVDICFYFLVDKFAKPRDKVLKKKK